MAGHDPELSSDIQENRIEVRGLPIAKLLADVIDSARFSGKGSPEDVRRFREALTVRVSMQVKDPMEANHVRPAGRAA